MLFVNGSTDKVGIGTNAPTATLDINGTLRIRGGAPQTNYVLSSMDSAGNATWTNVSKILTNGGAFLDALNDSISDKTSNLFLGNGSGLNSSGKNNTAVGILALGANTTGNGNTALGFKAGNSNTTGNFNTAIGTSSLASNTSGSQNVALGHSAGSALGIGTGNIFLGFQAGDNLTSGNNNIIIGNSVDFANTLASNQLNIADTITGDTNTKRIAIGFSTNTPDATLEVGNADRNFVNPAVGGADILVEDDIEVDGTAFALNFNGTNATITNATFTTANTGKLIASGSVNGLTANFSNANISGTANVSKLLASANINGSSLFITNKATVGSLISSGSVNGASATFTNASITTATIPTLNATNISTTKLIATGSVNGLTANFTTANISGTVTAGKLISNSNINGTALNISGMTNGSIAFFGPNGALSQNNAKLFWDKNNNKLGIGTNAPDATVTIASGAYNETALKLKAYSSPNASIFTVTNSANANLIDFGKNGNTLFNAQGLSDADFRVDGDTQGRLLFVDAGLDNVGIGTGTPTSFKLEVKGNVGPSADGTFNLGSNTKKWNKIFVNTINATTLSYDLYQESDFPGFTDLI